MNQSVAYTEVIGYEHSHSLEGLVMNVMDEILIGILIDKWIPSLTDVLLTRQ